MRKLEEKELKIGSSKRRRLKVKTYNLVRLRDTGKCHTERYIRN